MTYFLTTNQVIRINESLLGPDLLNNFSLLESAVLRPQTTVGGEDAYPDIHSKAAALFHSIVRNHAFIDGNKRTGLLSVVTFYAVNGHEVADETTTTVSLAVDTAEGLLTVDAIAGVLKTLVRRIND